jgi:hypothetical protein
MSLSDFLYRCPSCGHDPVEGDGDRARCPACGQRYELTPAGDRVRVGRNGDGDLVSLPELSRLLDEAGGPVPRALVDNGRLRYEARVRLRRATREDPVYHEGRLLGFAERLGEPVEWTLTLDGGRLLFRIGDKGVRAAPNGPAELTWELCTVTALQASSSSVQLSVGGEEVLVFRFREDSARRWELLLGEALRREWTRLDRGRIAEFQPRIRAE